MSKEKKYQEQDAQFLETQWEAYNGVAQKIYCEEFATEYNDALQECSPLIGKTSDELKSKYRIVGIKEKLLEFNKSTIEKFIAKHKRTESVEVIVDLMFEQFRDTYKVCKNEAQLFQLIFTPYTDLSGDIKRQVSLPGCKEVLSYNAIYYETPGNYKGKNSFYIIRERRIPVHYHEHKASERPDFMMYINGIPLVLIEYKTENSGLAASLKDFEFKESYKSAPFKVALNNGQDVIFFSEVSALKYKNKDTKDTSFKWVHYLPEKKYIGQREYFNIEYLYDELMVQPENMYTYCMSCCSVVNTNAQQYLINARIQQYYAIKDIKSKLNSNLTNQLAVPYNYEFAHAQRSGKTITMKLISYLIAKEFKQVFNTIFIYVPDLQIKDVLTREFSLAGDVKLNLQIIESRDKYQKIVEQMQKEELSGVVYTGFRLIIVNMQKITDDELLMAIKINSNKVLNIIDEAHHGQTSKTASHRESIFPNASNYLFTATAKPEMRSHYFPKQTTAGFINRFTISQAKSCQITVPVLFLKAEKNFTLSKKVSKFANDVEKRLANDYSVEADIIDEQNNDIDDFLDLSTKKVASYIKSELKQETIIDQINYVTDFLDSVRGEFEFWPKAILYADSVSVAKAFIKEIQKVNSKNYFNSYRWGVDFSAIDENNCEALNPGISQVELIDTKFQAKRKTKLNQQGLIELDCSESDDQIIDILVAVDKYQKGFDLPELVATFLATKINEPSRLNQIYTRTATKRTGKEKGFCVDLTLNSKNHEVFIESLKLYDSVDGADNIFLDSDKIKKITENLTLEFKKLKEILNLDPSNFTTQMILQQVLNEKDLTIRQDRQHHFFYLTKKIISDMAKVGSPLFFNKFSVDLNAIYGAFKKFNEIYADKAHIDRGKILINTDSTSNTAYIKNDEIKEIVRTTLAFLGETSIKNLLKFSYSATAAEITLDSDKAKELSNNIKRESSASGLEDEFKDLGQYLKHSNPSLYNIIRNIIVDMSNNRALIYEDLFHQKVLQAQEDIKDSKKLIEEKIKLEFGGNKFLFWSNQISQQIFKSYGINSSEGFSRLLASEIFNCINIILPQVSYDLPMSSKIEIVKEIFTQKSDITTFSQILIKFLSSNTISQNEKNDLQNEIKKVPKSEEGILFAANATIFSNYLQQTLFYYYK